MKSYCPYDNIAAKAYPDMLVRTSFNDSQVMYWEPAKYVAKMRATRTDHTPAAPQDQHESRRPWRRVRALRPSARSSV